MTLCTEITNLPESGVEGPIGCPGCQIPLNIAPPDDADPFRFSADKHWLASAFLDGEPVTDVVEVMTGVGGWAVRLALPVRRCACPTGDVVRFLHRSNGYTVVVPTKTS